MVHAPEVRGSRESGVGSRVEDRDEVRLPAAVSPLPEASWQRQHVLDLDDFTADEIELVMQTTNAMKDVLRREVRRAPALRGLTIATLFYEASTRTRASF